MFARTVCCVSLLSATALSHAPSHASQKDSQLTLMAGHAGASNVTTTEDDPRRINIDSGTGFTLAFNYIHQRRQPNINLQYEVVFAQNTLTPQVPLEDGSRRDVELDVTHLHIGGLHEWVHSEHLTTYFGGTLGVSHLEIPSGDSELDPSMGFSLGVKVPMGKRLMARLEARVYGIYWDSDNRIFCSTGGDLNEGICKLEIDASLWWHQQLNAGITYRF